MTNKTFMTTRKRNDTPALADLEGATNPMPAPGPYPPPGTPARVRTTIDYERPIETDNYSEELRDLAASEYSTEELPEPSPLDPYTEFVNAWRKFVGYPLKIVRLPDPAHKRMPGNTYSSPCFELTMLSDVPFDPNNLTGMLQVINNNSGGVFRVFLTDEVGTPIPGARLDRLVIADPPKQYNQQRQQRQYPGDAYDYDIDAGYGYRRQRELPAPAPPPKSETELYIEQMQRELFQKVMMRALDPPAPPTPDPLAGLPADTRLALGLLEKGDMLETAVSRIANLAQAPDRIESATWKDKLADAGIQLVTHNPQIITTVTDIISRATVALASAFAPRLQQSQVVNEPIPVQHAPAQRVPAPSLPYQGGRIEPLPPQMVNGLPETPQPEDDGLDAAEDAEIDMMEEIVKLLLSEKPLSLTDPVILDIKASYPEIFEKALAGIAATPSMIIIQYLCARSDFCADLFNSQRNGAYLRQRLEEFKGLLTGNASQAENTDDTAPETA